MSDQPLRVVFHTSHLHLRVIGPGREPIRYITFSRRQEATGLVEHWTCTCSQGPTCDHIAAGQAWLAGQQRIALAQTTEV